MVRLGDIKAHGARLFSAGEPLQALQVFDAIVRAAPLHFEARLRVADCLAALDELDAAAAVYRGTAWYALKSGHPLAALVAARVLETMGAEHQDLLTALVMYYGSESELVGKFAARINTPPPETELAIMGLASPIPVSLVAEAARFAATCTDTFEDFPAVLHPIPLLSQLSEDAFRRVLGTLVVRRLPPGVPIMEQGESGTSFFFVATGEVRVFMTDPSGVENELARLHESAIFGEMALISAKPRSASVATVSDTDLLEVTRDSLRTLADELGQIAAALTNFMRERVLRNMMATHALFKPFNEAQRHDLLRRFSNLDIAPGTAIIHEGDRGIGLFVVVAGEVEVSKCDAQGVATSLAVLGPGAVFGEMALLHGSPTTATVVARTPATVLVLARDQVTRMIAGVPEIKAYLEELASDRHLDTQLAIGDWDAEDDAAVLI